jgi:hypothetical protein
MAGQASAERAWASISRVPWKRQKRD